MTRDELDAWIIDLRGRVQRGELRRRGLEPFARHLLALVDTWRSTPREERLEPGALADQRQIAVDLADLHGYLVEGKPEPGIAREWRRVRA